MTKEDEVPQGPEDSCHNVNLPDYDNVTPRQMGDSTNQPRTNQQS